MRDEFVRVLSLDVVRSERIRREVFQIERDDDACLRTNGGCQHMPIVRVRKLQIFNQALMASDKAVRNGAIHQIARAVELVRSQVGSLRKNRPDPFSVNFCGPLRTE